MSEILFFFTKRMYSLENLDNATPEQINQILTYFGQPLLDEQRNKLNAIIASYNNNILALDERSYVSSPYFNKLFLAAPDSVRSLAQEYGLPEDNHIRSIKSIIDNVNNLRIPIVDRWPNLNLPLSVYQIGQTIYVCGKNTFNIKEDLKRIGGLWSPQLRCWTVNSSMRNALSQLPVWNSIKHIQKEYLLDIIDLPYSPISDGGMTISRLGDNIFLCGPLVSNYTDRLKLMGGRFINDTNCWIFPLSQVNSLKMLVKLETESYAILNSFTGTGKVSHYDIRNAPGPFGNF